MLISEKLFNERLKGREFYTDVTKQTDKARFRDWYPATIDIWQVTNGMTINGQLVRHDKIMNKLSIGRYGFCLSPEQKEWMENVKLTNELSVEEQNLFSLVIGTNCYTWKDQERIKEIRKRIIEKHGKRIRHTIGV